MDRGRPRSHAFVASTCLLLAAVANRSLTGAAFLVAFGIWGAVVVATSGGGGGARDGIGSRGRWDSRRLGHGLWASVAALAAIVTAAQARLVPGPVVYCAFVLSAGNAHKPGLVFQCCVSACLQCGDSRLLHRAGRGRFVATIVSHSLAQPSPLEKSERVCFRRAAAAPSSIHGGQCAVGGHARSAPGAAAAWLPQGRLAPRPHCGERLSPNISLTLPTARPTVLPQA